MKQLLLLVAILVSACEQTPRPPLQVKPGDLVAVPSDRVNELKCVVPTAKLECGNDETPPGGRTSMVFCKCL